MNSSMNIIFYGVFNQQFRQTAKKVFLEKFEFCRPKNLEPESCKQRGVNKRNEDFDKRRNLRLQIE